MKITLLHVFHCGACTHPPAHAHLHTHTHTHLHVPHAHVYIPSEGLLNVGDSVLAVNGRSVVGKTVDEVADTLQVLQGLISFKIMPENQHGRRPLREVGLQLHYQLHLSQPVNADSLSLCLCFSL